MNLALAAVSFIHGAIEYPEHGAGDVGPNSIALHVAHDRLVWHINAPFTHSNFLAALWQTDMLVTHRTAPLVDSLSLTR